MSQPFHEVRFPLDLALASRGGPRRLTDIVQTGAGREVRNARWAHARRRYEAGLGVRTLARLAEIVAFFEERRGRLYGFRFRDRLDDRSGPPGIAPTPRDQRIGTGDGATARFALVKTYGAGGPAPYVRPIAKPVAGSVVVAVGRRVLTPAEFTADATTGWVTLSPAAVPASGQPVTAGYLFDVPVRFDTDDLTVDLTAFEAGEAPDIPLVEIIP
jgi:uncharacterized protein (TIGR02217 family)